MLGVTSQTPFTYLVNVKALNFVRGGGGGWGKNLVKAVFKSVYCRLAASSIQKHVKKGRCPKPFGHDCRCDNSLPEIYQGKHPMLTSLPVRK